MINKIALGSANFSQNYGLNNFSFANNNLLLNLLNTATKKKFNFWILHLITSYPIIVLKIKT